MSVDVLIPESADAAVEAYGDGSDIMVLAGGTIVMQLLNYHRIPPMRTLLLHKAGLSYVNRNGSTYTIGAMTPVSDLTDLVAPLGPCASNVGDHELQHQATIGGNLCAPAPPDYPGGDLQGPLIALGATVRSVGAGGERTDGVEDFLSDRQGRLVLDISFDVPAAGAYATLDRPHTRHPTILSVSGANTADGSVRLAATGGGPTGVRLSSAEAAYAIPHHAQRDGERPVLVGHHETADPGAAGIAALQDVELTDDTVASAWYRERTLPLLVKQVLGELKEAS